VKKEVILVLNFHFFAYSESRLEIEKSRVTPVGISRTIIAQDIEKKLPRCLLGKNGQMVQSFIIDMIIRVFGKRFLAAWHVIIIAEFWNCTTVSRPQNKKAISELAGVIAGSLED